MLQDLGKAFAQACAEVLKKADHGEATARGSSMTSSKRR